MARNLKKSGVLLKFFRCKIFLSPSKLQCRTLSGLSKMVLANAIAFEVLKYCTNSFPYKSVYLQKTADTTNISKRVKRNFTQKELLVLSNSV